MSQLILYPFCVSRIREMASASRKIVMKIKVVDECGVQHQDYDGNDKSPVQLE
jgi:hypothetical protein